MENGFYLKFIAPENTLTDFVEYIGIFRNESEKPKEVVVLPDGRIDLFFSRSASNPFQVTLVGLETAPKLRSIPPQTCTFVISFKPLAVEYILHTSIASLLNSGTHLSPGFLDFAADDLTDFDTFYSRSTEKFTALLPTTIDNRKRTLFELIYSSKGETSVKELADKAAWSSRQINRYFNQQLGLSLKAYCNILRFRASLEHIAKGKLFPELNFSDQTHFIKEIKKFSGVVPTELFKNKNDRFVLLSLLKQA
ncbi:helix-turn-helix domain-containing protein [Pedobacter endophyticus]|uniref:AraC family transcriptional regulator n=1 Tax=Pedobacter endophyticus TaxID=2789740 RepID=A0A7S9KZ20_9SPHI|nr:helix-turn-helix domain-containing protein [Pedobacter endophyticus]QPH39101.1 AraC family transcriptional regulator [Pedobacter endophyticus]